MVSPISFRIGVDVVTSWCEVSERLLEESLVRRVSESRTLMDTDDSGPHTELEFWKDRSAKYTSLVEQLSHHDCGLVLAVLNAARASDRLTTTSFQRWKLIDSEITDALNEAKVIQKRG